MKKLMLFLVICISMVALIASPVLASWGGGTGDDAVQVVGDVTLVGTTYSITGTLTALSSTPSAAVLLALAASPGTWELDFGKQNYYLGTFGTGTGITIQGKLCKNGEIDVYVVGTTSNGRTEGGPPPWSPKYVGP